MAREDRGIMFSRLEQANRITHAKLEVPQTRRTAN